MSGIFSSRCPSRVDSALRDGLAVVRRDVFGN
jgi:hypothetical protein